MRGVGISLLAAAGGYILFPVIVALGLLWFVDFLRGHHDAQAAIEPVKCVDPTGHYERECPE